MRSSKSTTSRVFNCMDCELMKIMPTELSIIGSLRKPG
jgi:hypothetical protein